MSNWNRTFKTDAINDDGHKATAQVWTAITDAPRARALGSLDLSVDTDKGHASIRMSLTPQQMQMLADLLFDHAYRLDRLTAEAKTLTQEAA